MNKLDEIRDQITALQAEVATRQSRIDETQSVIAEAEELDRHIASLRADRADLLAKQFLGEKVSTESVDKELVAAEKQAAKLEPSATGARGAVVVLQSELEPLFAQIRDLERQIPDLRYQAAANLAEIRFGAFVESANKLAEDFVAARAAFVAADELRGSRDPLVGLFADCAFIIPAPAPKRKDRWAPSFNLQTNVALAVGEAREAIKRVAG